MRWSGAALPLARGGRRGAPRASGSISPGSSRPPTTSRARPCGSCSCTSRRPGSRCSSTRVMAVSALGTLVWRHPLADVSQKAAAPIGAAFTLICLVTGALWGKPMWGTYWVWDARLTSVLVLFLMYCGILALWRDDRGSEPGRPRRRDPDARRRRQPADHQVLGRLVEHAAPAGLGAAARRADDPPVDALRRSSSWRPPSRCSAHAAPRRHAHRDPAPARAHASPCSRPSGSTRQAAVTMDLGPHAGLHPRRLCARPRLDPRRADPARRARPSRADAGARRARAREARGGADVAPGAPAAATVRMSRPHPSGAGAAAGTAAPAACSVPAGAGLRRAGASCSCSGSMPGDPSRVPSALIGRPVPTSRWRRSPACRATGGRSPASPSADLKGRGSRSSTSGRPGARPAGRSTRC